MQLIVHARVEDFLRVSAPFLEANEAAYNLILGLSTSLKVAHEPAPVLAGTVIDRGQVAAAFLKSANRNLILTDIPYDLIPETAEKLSAQKINIPGILGPSSTALSFAQVWAKIENKSYQTVSQQRIYQLKKVIAPPPAPGQMRTANVNETKLIFQWLKDFMAESSAHEVETEENLKQMAERGIMSGRIFVWEQSGEAVSMAGLSGLTRRGVRVNCVYTPHLWRGKGLATNLVAALSQFALDLGRHYCCLYTDLQNPVANRIYQQIGYQPVADSSLILFK